MFILTLCLSNLLEAQQTRHGQATSLASELTIPKHAFSLSTTSPSGTITPSGVDGTVTITASASIFSASDVDQFLEIDNGFGEG